MKLMWFHLMPYTELPDDFKREASVGLGRHPLVAVRPQARPPDVQRLHGRAGIRRRLAAIDAICVNEHHSNGYGLMPSPNLIAASLARRTTDATICVMGNSLALYNPPTRVAEEFAMIDVHLRRTADRRLPGRHADGRLLRLRPEPAASLRERYYEAHDLVMKAWQQQDTFAFNGRYNQQRYVNIWPRPIQQPHPPVWIPGGGSIETWQWCAEMDYVYCYLSYFGHKVGKATMDGLLGGDGPPGQGPQSVSRRLRADRGGGGKPSSRRWSSTRKRRNTSSAAACTSILASPRRPATPPKQPCASADQPGQRRRGALAWRGRPR